MIRSFRDQATERLFRREFVKRFEHIERPARRQLYALDAAEDLRTMDRPGYRLEKLKGQRRGQYSIRINKQWRICFIWRDGDAHDVEITDYH